MNSKTHTPLHSESSEAEHLQKSKQKPSAEPAERTVRKVVDRRKLRLVKPGDTIGRFLILALIPAKKDRKAVYRCECGNLGISRVTSLTSARRKSCGCSPTKKKSGFQRAKPRTVKVGDIFGRLTVIGQIKTQGSPEAAYRCECGNLGLSLNYALLRGTTKSCGCLRASKRQPAPKWWMSIIKGISDRCLDSNSANWPRYGGRGIEFYEPWRQNPVDMLHHIGPRPSATHSVDRINNDKGYVPGNVRWATRKEQSNNKRNNVVLEFEGESKTLSQWAEQLGVCPGTIRHRLRIGWDIGRAVSQPPEPRYRRSRACSSKNQANPPSALDTACAL